MSERIKFLLEEMTFNASYELMEQSKSKDELKEVAAKRGIQIPSKDISIFKCSYGMIDEENRNGCTLPKKEVKAALKTLVGKAIDKDHLRKSTIGYWLDAKIEDKTIIAYGAFWKSNFPEDYEFIQDKINNGKMKISFEAWGERKFTSNGSYELYDIEFAGGALLFDTEPAFPNAEVLDFASMKNQVLEFAKVIEKEKEETQMEEARMNFNYDNETIARVMFETECPGCKVQGWNDILAIDFEESKVKSRCPACSAVTMYDLKPSSQIIKKGKPVQAKVEQTKAKEEATKNSNEKGGQEVEELLKKFNKATVEELSKFFDETLASLSAKDTEIASLKKTAEDANLLVENAKLELEKVKTEFATVKTDLDTRIAAEKASFVKARRDELGEEFAKDLTDEDITNDLKFENAKLKKELAAAKLEKSNVEKKTDGLDAGAKTDEKVSEVFAKQDAIQKKAFGA